MTENENMGETDIDGSDDTELSETASVEAETPDEMSGVEEADSMEMEASSDAPITDLSPVGMRSSGSDSIKKEPFITEEMRSLFGFKEGSSDDDLDSYEPIEGAPRGFPWGAVVALVLICAAGVATYIVSKGVIGEREEEIAADVAAIEEAHKNKTPPPKRWGLLTLLASDPGNVHVYRNDRPIFTKQSMKSLDGKDKDINAWGMMRIADPGATVPTMLKDIKITSEPYRLTLKAEGFEDYTIVIKKHHWQPQIEGKRKDNFKEYSNIFLIPRAGQSDTIYPASLEEKEALKALHKKEEAERKAGDPLPHLSPPFNFLAERKTRADYMYNYIYEQDPETGIALKKKELAGRVTFESDPPGAKIFINRQPLFLPDPSLAPENACDYVMDAIAKKDFSRQAATPLKGASNYCYKYVVKKLLAPPKPALPAGVLPEGAIPGAVTPPVEAPGTIGGLAIAGSSAVSSKKSGNAIIETSWVSRKFAFYDENEANGRSFSIHYVFNQPNLEPFFTNILPREWACVPVTDPATRMLRIAEAPKKIVPEPPEPGSTVAPALPKDDLYHYLCDYEYRLSFNHRDVESYRKKAKSAETP